MEDLELLDRRGARALEPALDVEGALLSPRTGIVDSHGFMLALQGEAEEAGAMIAFRCPVVGGRATDDGIRLDAGGAHPVALLCRTVVNCAGLGAQALLAAIDGMPVRHIVPDSWPRGATSPCAAARPSAG